jgi:hypothetical protein
LLRSKITGWPVVDTFIEGELFVAEYGESQRTVTAFRSPVQGIVQDVPILIE